MRYLVHNLSWFKHNRYLFTKPISRNGSLSAVLKQTVQGPLVSNEVELDESDIETLYIYTFRKGKLSSVRNYMCVKVSKLFSLEKDYVDHIAGWGSYEYDYIRLKKGSRTEVDHKLYPYGWFESSSFDVYGPGGIIKSLNNNRDHAISIYNNFLIDASNKYVNRIIERS